MQIVKVNQKDVLKQAVDVLQSGVVVTFPTETSYGLACDMTNKEAVEKVYIIKKRPIDNPLSMLVASIEMAREYVEFSEKALELAEQYWPGALTLVLPAKIPNPKFQAPNPKCQMINKSKIQNTKFKIHLLPHQTTIALRISSHPFAQKLVQQFGRPISATSANISGSENIYDPDILLKQFNEVSPKPDILIDAGVLPSVPPSTIVEVEGEEVRVLRKGSIVINSKLKAQNSKCNVK